jgi:integrase
MCLRYGLAAETGLRAGELCGLAVDDIDLEREMLQMRQSAWPGKLGDPKTDDSIRVVELSPQACTHLRTFLKSWHPNERRLLFATMQWNAGGSDPIQNARRSALLPHPLRVGQGRVCRHAGTGRTIATRNAIDGILSTSRAPATIS